VPGEFQRIEPKGGRGVVLNFDSNNGATGVQERENSAEKNEPTRHEARDHATALAACQSKSPMDSKVVAFSNPARLFSIKVTARKNSFPPAGIRGSLRRIQRTPR
jgi:hypothetical protein